MKKVKAIISLTLSALLLGTAAVPAGAEKASAEDDFLSSLTEQWEDTYESKLGITIHPGKTESERNFSWYMSEEISACSVKISKSSDMKNAEVFEGEAVTTYQGDKSARVTVTGLKENTTYYYVVVSGKKESKVYSFRTEDDTYSALYISDIHVYDNPEDEKQLKKTSFAFAQLLDKALEKSDISFVLSGGDMATEGRRVEYEGLSFSDISRSMTISHIMGNHDRHCFDFKDFTNFPNEVFGPMSGYQAGNYYFEKGGVLYLCVDTNNASSTAHRDMIKEACEVYPDAKWRVVMMHHDLYGGSIPHRETECSLFRILLSPIFDEFNIDLVLMGHSHHYSVSDVIYDGESVAKIEDGKTIKNAGGTVYLVSTSIARPEEDSEIVYSDLVSIGMEKLTDKLYNIIDVSPEALKVTTYYADTNEEYISFTLEKTDDYKPQEISLTRKIIGIICGGLSTLYGIYVNADRYFELKEEGFEAPFFEFVF